VTVSGRGLGRAGRRALTALELQGLAAVPLEAECFANIDNPRTRPAYRIDIREFMGFVRIGRPEEFRKVTRAHVLAWRKDLEGECSVGQPSGASSRRSSRSFEHLCDANAVTHNPVKGMKRPKVESYEGKTPAVGDGQARALLDAPGVETEKRQAGSRHPRCAALPWTATGGAVHAVRDIHPGRGVLHLRVHGQRRQGALPALTYWDGGGRHRLPRGRGAWG
jgi:hypothetical protein